MGDVLLGVATAYALIALWAVCIRMRQRSPPCGVEPVSVLKPLCGSEPGLVSRLSSFCRQDHPCFQLVFGVRDEHDPALGDVARLRRQFPGVDIAVVIGGHVVGLNPKVSNLCNMRSAAKHARLVVADSDIRVGPDYLRTVSAPLANDRVGLVTCLYHGTAGGGFWSRLGAQFVNGWFLPSVLVSRCLGGRVSAFGATIAVRSEVLDTVGGFEALAAYLADDYMLGVLVARTGRRIELSSYVVDTLVAEPNLTTLWRHELRWARTIRALQPLGHLGSVVTLGLPVALVGVILSGGTGTGWTLFALAVGLRVAIPFAVARCIRINGDFAAPMPPLWLLPLRDLFSLCVWAASWRNTPLYWRGQRYRLERGGVFRPLGR